MLNKKTLITLIASVCVILPVGCTSQNEIDETINPIVENTATGDDIMFLKTNPTTITKSDITAVSDEFRDILETKNSLLSRSANELEVYHFEDATAKRDAYAIANPTFPNSCIIECQSTESNASVIISFEQVSDNEFIALDEEGKVMRSFVYDPETQILWTSNDPERQFSKQDQFLCNTMFTSLNVLICGSLSVTTLGGSLLVGLGCQVAAYYVCN